MKKKTVSFSKKSVNVFFHILTRCNLSCRHCYINPEEHGKKTLPINVIEEWLSALLKKKQSANVIFLGGEPTLHPELPRAVKKARALGYKSITIDTNGYLFNDILEKISPMELDFLSFSIDGATGKTNDRIRGQGSFDACMKGIRQAVSIGFNTSLIFTVSSANIHELSMMPPLLEDLGIDRFFIQVIGLRGNSDGSANNKINSANLQVSKKRWLDLIPEAARNAAGRGIIATYPKVYLRPEEQFECAGLVADNYFIFPNGRVYRCPLCEDFPIHSLMFEDNRLKSTPGISEGDLFHLNIPEGCVMNRLIQPENLEYTAEGKPKHKIACCLLKEEVY
ncbi:MAG: radical SAM protein [Deltaproteobacteria bacterium]|nr:radical SAM protein [Deltaproteobacteria bacterium]